MVTGDTGSKRECGGQKERWWQCVQCMVGEISDYNPGKNYCGQRARIKI